MGDSKKVLNSSFVHRFSATPIKDIQQRVEEVFPVENQKKVGMHISNLVPFQHPTTIRSRTWYPGCARGFGGFSPGW